jgi:hypothetical protein
LRGPTAPDVATFNRVNNIRSFRFYVTDEGLSGLNYPWHNICQHAYLNSIDDFERKVLRHLRSALQDDYSIDLKEDVCRFAGDKKPFELMFIGGVSYEGSKESAPEKGTIYATPIYGKQQDLVNQANKARHDTVLVNFENNGQDSYVPARIILMIQANNLREDGRQDDDTKILLLV